MDTSGSSAPFILRSIHSVQAPNMTSILNGNVSTTNASVFNDEVAAPGPSLQESDIPRPERSASKVQHAGVKKNLWEISHGRQKSRSKSQRTKVSRACDACKLKRTRCSGDQPCVRCRHLAICCDYFAVYTRGRLPSVPLSLLPAQTEVQTRPQWEPNNIDLRKLPISDRHSHHVDRSDDYSKGVAHASSRNSPVPSANIGGQYHGPSSPITFLERAWKRLKENHTSGTSSTLEKEISTAKSILVTDDNNHLRLADEEFHMPSKLHAYALVERYFELSTPFFQFLHHQTIKGLVDKLYQQMSDHQSAQDAISQQKVTLLLMIFAVASFDDTKESFPSFAGSRQSEVFLEAAQRRLQRESGFPVLDSAQTRLIECFHLLSTQHASEVYLKFGTAVALFITLGLHRRKRLGGYRSEIGVIEHECRKRTFWAAYVLDRYLSVMGGRPRTLQDFDTDQDLPARVDDNELTSDGIKPQDDQFDCEMDAPIMHIELARISGQSSAKVYPLQRITQEERITQADRITRSLADWKAQLPAFLGVVPASSLVPKFQRQSITLRLAHAHAVIHANRPFLLSNFANTSKESELPQRLVKYINDCINAARTIVDILTIFDGNGIPFRSWWFVQYVSFCAVAVIYIYTIQQRQRMISTPAATTSEISPRHVVQTQGREKDYFEIAEHCQQRLAATARDNSPGKRYAIVLEELRQETSRYVSTSGLVYDEVGLSLLEEVEQCAEQSGVHDGWAAEIDTDFTHIFDDWGVIN